MSKRYNNFENFNTKKPKYDDNIDWGDDLDNQAIEDCFKLATQVGEGENIICTQRNNVTLLSTYNAFKDHRPCSSTQYDFTQTTSLNNDSNNFSLEFKMKQLRQKYEEKEGQISILRSQLKEMKSKTENEQQKKLAEWTDKLNASQKEIKSIRSELEFKNLTIANLKQQISEISKYVEINQDNTNKQCSSEEKRQVEDNFANYSIEILTKTNCPLRSRNFVEVFQSRPTDKYKVKVKNKNIKNLENHDITSVNSYIFLLINSSLDELNSFKQTEMIKKIISVSEELLHEFHNYLQYLEGSCQLVDIQQADSIYLQTYQKIDSNQEEIGIEAGKSVKLIAELFSFNSYLSNYIINSKNKSYLNLIFNTIEIIGRIRKSQVSTKYLCSVNDLLQSASENSNFEQLCDLTLKLIWEILFSRPNLFVIQHLLVLFKFVSKHSQFSNFLCKEMNKSTRNQVKSTKGVLYFNRDSCILHMFAILFKNIPMENEEMCLDILTFIQNLIETNSNWLHQQERKHCECLCQLYKFTINIINKTLKKFEEIQPTEKDNYLEIFKSSIKILCLLNFNSYEILEKFVTVYAQYKNIITTFIQFQDEFRFSQDILTDLDKLNISEDVSSVSSNNFAKVTSF